MNCSIVIIVCITVLLAHLLSASCFLPSQLLQAPMPIEFCLQIVVGHGSLQLQLLRQIQCQVVDNCKTSSMPVLLKQIAMNILAYW